jgi:hypothetical protein
VAESADYLTLIRAASETASVGKVFSVLRFAGCLASAHEAIGVLTVAMPARSPEASAEHW